MYSLRDFGDMLADTGRFRAYAQAIAKTVQPGDVVAEIGCGPGVFAMLACRAGARRVFAIETDDCIEIARRLAIANGFADRVEFFQGDSHKVDLPEPANVIVADIRGTMPLYGSAIASLNDARERLLVPGGHMIPRCDTLKAALVDSQQFYSRLTAPWQESIPEFDLAEASLHILHQPHGGTFEPKDLLTEPQSWGVLDYAAGAPRRVTSQLTFRIQRDGIAHGICLWFDATLVDGIGYSSGPGGESKIYGQLFLPWPKAAPVSQDQAVEVGLQANGVGKDYVWRWESKIFQNGAAPLHFRQSTMDGAIFSPASLRRHSADCVPQLTEEGEAQLWLLSAMDGKMSLAEIAKEASARFPRLFPSWQQAFECAIELASKFSR